jgi:DNA-binding transcriptional LysR family regulator
VGAIEKINFSITTLALSPSCQDFQTYAEDHLMELLVRMDWDKLRVFYHVGKCRSFNRASEKLNISQSSISRGIQLLEYQIKQPLFNRTPRGLTLTKHGEILLDAVEKMFINLETARAIMEEESNEPRGSLKVATTVALASIWLVELVPHFSTLHPHIHLDIIGHDEGLDMKMREADVSIRPFFENQPDLIQTYLFSIGLRLYASPEYLEKYGSPTKVEDLNHHRIITFGESTIRPYSDIDWPLRIGAQEGEVRKPYISINSSYGAARLAEQGLGIVALSQEYPNINSMNLVPILPTVTGPTIDLFYVYPESLKNSKRVKVFGDFLVSNIPNDFKRAQEEMG